MENIDLMLFICLAAPLSMMFFVFKGRPRSVIGFLLIGIFMCLFAGEINGLILNRSGLPLRFITVNITPIVEETLKALPVVFAAFLIKPKRQLLLEGSIAVGVGFATLENVCTLVGTYAALSPGLILTRGFGAGMMHGITTLAVGYSMTFVERDRKFSCTGTVAALSAAIIYHSIYNIIVQSQYPALGILLPAVSFIPLLIAMNKKRSGHKES